MRYLSYAETIAIYDKAKKIIASCKTHEQLRVAIRYIKQYSLVVAPLYSKIVDDLRARAFAHMGRLRYDFEKKKAY